jgi:hypothetical protein
MAEPRCDRTDLLVSACAHCRGHDDLPGRVDALSPPEAWTRARYDYDRGCPVCHGCVSAGDRIALCDGVWVCETCGEGATG